jgi:PAS domain S-box-containing protein
MGDGLRVRETGVDGAAHTMVEERLAAILDHVADAIVVASEDGRIENVNPAAAQLFGWDGETLKGQRLEVLMGPADSAGHAGHLKRYLTTGSSGILNVGPRALTAHRRDGSTAPIELSVGEAWVGGERKFIGVCRDISQRLASEAKLRETVNALNRTVAELKASSELLERERLQSEALARAAEAARAQAESANLAKTRFLATMSHEIRTPLNGVIAVADVLARRVQAGEDRDLVDIIAESGRNLLSLLNEILDLARVESGGLSLRPAPFSLQALLTSLAATWRFAASAKGVELRVDADGVPMLVGDAGRLRQVISNLISNAIKFTEQGSVSVDCRCDAIDGGLARIELTVSDTGQGFDPSLAESLFEPFFQADSTNTRRHGGTGLGLAICRELVDLMGGEIHASGAPGAGARMTLRLTLPVADAPADGGEAEADAEVGWIEAAPRLLVAEDHPLNRRIMGMLLDEMGLDYEIVEDGAAAVEAAARGGFDLVLMDIQMPGLDGLDATRAIRGLPGPAGRVPVIAVTADVMSDYAGAYAAAGMNDLLAKPIQPAQLHQMLVKHLSSSEARRPAA